MVYSSSIVSNNSLRNSSHCRSNHGRRRLSRRHGGCYADELLVCLSTVRCMSRKRREGKENGGRVVLSAESKKAEFVIDPKSLPPPPSPPICFTHSFLLSSLPTTLVSPFFYLNCFFFTSSSCSTLVCAFFSLFFISYFLAC